MQADQEGPGWCETKKEGQGMGFAVTLQAGFEPMA